MTIVDELRTNPEIGVRRLEGEYKTGLLSLARRICPDQGDAEELVNRTFAAVVEGIDDYVEQSAFFAWMCQILTNLHSADERRKSRRNEVAASDAGDGPDDDAASRIYENVDAAILRDAIDRLPKDMKALKTLAHDHYVEVPVIEAIGESNEQQKRRAVQLIMAQGKRKVGILGLSFKAGTDDLRCSPIVDVVENLLGKGFEIRIYDKNVKVSELTGTNKDFIMAKIPHLQHFVTDRLDEVCRESDVLVVTNKESEFVELTQRYPNKIIVDLVRQWRDVDYDGHYEGLSWGDINANRTAQSEQIEKDFRMTDF